MFEIKENDVTGQTNKLLFNIWQELRSLKSLRPSREDTGKTIDLDSLKRNELMALVKNMTERPDGWTKFSNEQLKQLLRKEGT